MAGIRLKESKILTKNETDVIIYVLISYKLHILSEFYEIFYILRIWGHAFYYAMIKDINKQAHKLRV